MTTPFCYQNALGGGIDAFIAKFDPDTGFRVWGTYFGGPADEYQDYTFINADDTTNLYVTGYTYSTSGISSAQAWQPAFGGGVNADGYVASFNRVGNKRWSSYIGGSGEDQAFGCAFDGSISSLYVVGESGSTTNIATAGSFLDHGGGIRYKVQGFLARYTLNDTDAPILNVAEQNVNNNHIRITPNPTDGVFVVDGALASTTGSATLTIFNLLGEILYSVPVIVTDGQFTQKIDLSATMVPGQYIVRIATDRQVMQLRCLKR
ncbi:MAG: T9SS C-terminal target domain-containing protein [Chitinophagia bacterium]|nr:T9SS C-terminal target domain-containing protein [Chitinophagia bacterium]